MLDERAVSVARSYWAAHLGCSPDELFAQSFRILTHAGELSDYCGAFALFRDDAVAASLPANRADTLRSLLSCLSLPWSPRSFASALSTVATAVIGPAYIGYAAAVSQPVHSARGLGVADAAALQTLQRSCDPTDWEHGGSPFEHPCSGIFLGSQLVALAGYEVWGGSIAHISVVTHADFRSRGFGRSAVAHLSERALRAGLLPQYRTLESNRASIRIAESVGFRLYATSTAVRLKHYA